MSSNGLRHSTSLSVYTPPMRSTTMYLPGQILHQSSTGLLISSAGINATPANPCFCQMSFTAQLQTFDTSALHNVHALHGHLLDPVYLPRCAFAHNYILVLTSHSAMEASGGGGLLTS